jgi:hypothetical protein
MLMLAVGTALVRRFVVRATTQRLLVRTTGRTGAIAVTLSVRDKRGEGNENDDPSAAREHAFFQINRRPGPTAMRLLVASMPANKEP